MELAKTTRHPKNRGPPGGNDERIIGQEKKIKITRITVENIWQVFRQFGSPVFKHSNLFETQLSFVQITALTVIIFRQKE